MLINTRGCVSLFLSTASGERADALPQTPECTNSTGLFKKAAGETQTQFHTCCVTLWILDWNEFEPVLSNPFSRNSCVQLCHFCGFDLRDISDLFTNAHHFVAGASHFISGGCRRRRLSSVLQSWIYCIFVLSCFPPNVDSGFQLPQIVIFAFKERWLQIPSLGFHGALDVVPSPATLGMFCVCVCVCLCVCEAPGWAVARCDVNLETKDS